MRPAHSPTLPQLIACRRNQLAPREDLKPLARKLGDQQFTPFIEHPNAVGLANHVDRRPASSRHRLGVLPNPLTGQAV